MNFYIISKHDRVRGPFARELFDQKLDDRHSVDSGALVGEPNHQVDFNTVDIAMDYGLNLCYQTSRKIGEHDLSRADMIVVMNWQEYLEVEEYDDKIRFMTHWHPKVQGGIEEGHGKSREKKEEILELIAECVKHGSKILNNIW